MKTNNAASSKGLTRRTFAGVVAGGLAASSRGRAQERPPNILFIVSSQHRGDALGAAGHPVVRTPVIDLLVKNGVILPRVYSAAPENAPARASLFTGAYPADHGILTEDDKENALRGALPAVLKDQGYRTALAGRYGLPGAEELFDWKWEFPDEYTPELLEKHPATEGDPSATDNKAGHELLRTGMASTPFSDFPTYRITDKALEFLDGVESDKPWFLMTAYWKPQPPFVVPMPWSNRYDKNDVLLPEMPVVPPGDEAPADRRLDYVHDRQALLVRLVRQHYLGAVSFIDDQIRRILRALTSTDRINDTLIVFTSDHGLLLGEHGHLFAGLPYDGALHVPAVFYWREHLETHRVNPAMDTTSIAPTILDLAGLETPKSMKGVSAKTLVSNEGDNGPSTAFSQLGFRTARTREWKLIDPGDAPGLEPQLYHVAQDVEERINLFDRPEGSEARKDLEAKLKRGPVG